MSNQFFKVMNIFLKVMVTLYIIVMFFLIIMGDVAKVKVKLRKYAVLSQVIDEREQVKLKAAAITLNQIMPSFETLAKFIKNPQQGDKSSLGSYIDYYEKVVSYFPSMADAQGTLGYCYYYLNNNEEALQAFQKAVEINPHYFWYQYDVGLMEFKKEEYVKAIASLERALKVRLDFSLKAFFVSKVFQQIIQYEPDLKESLDDNLKGGLRNTARLLAMSYFYLGVKSYTEGRYEQALNLFKASLKINASYPKAYEYLGLTLQGLGHEREAKDYLEKARVAGKVETLHLEEDFKKIAPKIF